MSDAAERAITRRRAIGVAAGLVGGAVTRPLSEADRRRAEAGLSLRPRSEANESYALVAWLLAENDVIPRDAVMSAETLPKVQMPARSHFVLDDRRGGQPFR